MQSDAQDRLSVPGPVVWPPGWKAKPALGDVSWPALPRSFSYLLSANVHVPHRNPTVRRTGDELPRELKVTQGLHPVTASDTHNSHLPQCGNQQPSSFSLNSLSWLESAIGILWPFGMAIWILV